MNTTSNPFAKAKLPQAARDPVALPQEVQQFALALSILIHRIGQLPHRDRDGLFALLQEWRKHGDDPDERARIQFAMQEIVTSAPIEIKRIDLVHRKPMAGERKSLAAFVGRKIKEVRESKSITQQDLAERAGLRQSHICRLENGDHTPTRHTLEKIAKGLGVEARMFDPIED